MLLLRFAHLRRGRDRPGGRAAVRARPSEGGGLGHVLTASHPQLTIRSSEMKLDIYVNYPGTCAAAFRFYEQHLGGKITMLRTHEDQPNQPGVPADWKKAILHARIEIGQAVLMGADIPGAEPMRSAYLTLRVDSAKEAERLYALLGEGGQIGRASCRERV